MAVPYLEAKFILVPGAGPPAAGIASTITARIIARRTLRLHSVQPVTAASAASPTKEPQTQGRVENASSPDPTKCNGSARTGVEGGELRDLLPTGFRCPPGLRSPRRPGLSSAS